jgi:hypothetical protein
MKGLSILTNENKNRLLSFYEIFLQPSGRFEEKTNMNPDIQTSSLQGGALLRIALVAYVSPLSRGRWSAYTKPARANCMRQDGSKQQALLGSNVFGIRRVPLLGCDAVWLLEIQRFGGTYCLRHQTGKNQRVRSNINSN